MREYSAKRLLLCFVLICGFAGILQLVVFRKRQDLHFKHHGDARVTAPAQPIESNLPPAEGVVAAIGMDRVHLSMGAAIKPFRCDNPGQYKVGEKLRITFTPGTPATATRVERIH